MAWMIAEGERAPEFEGISADGSVLKSSDYSGKRYVVYFYPRDFTPGCTVEADGFAQMYERFQAAGIEVIGVSPDSVESHAKFCKKMDIRFPLLADTDKKVSKAFGAWGAKKFMGREYMGVMRSSFLVDESGMVFKAYHRVKPKGHPEQVLEAFEAPR